MDKPNGKMTNIELELALDEMRRTLPFMIQMWSIDAENLFERRNALIEAGFSEKEALEIIKARGAQI